MKVIFCYKKIFSLGCSAIGNENEKWDSISFCVGTVNKQRSGNYFL